MLPRGSRWIISQHEVVSAPNDRVSRIVHLDGEIGLLVAVHVRLDEPAVILGHYPQAAWVAGERLIDAEKLKRLVRCSPIRHVGVDGIELDDIKRILKKVD